MEEQLYQVGELAELSGVSVRTLHYYGEIGILEPRERTEAGYRLYGAEAVLRLQRIRVLQELGVPLAEMLRLLEGKGEGLATELARLRTELATRISMLQDLQLRIGGVLQLIEQGGIAEPEQMFAILRLMSGLSAGLSDEERELYAERREAVGEQRIREVEAQWPPLIAAVRAQMQQGTDPRDPQVRELASQWRALVAEFSAGNPQLERGTVQRMREHGSELQQQLPEAIPDAELMDYIRRAMD